MTAGIVLALAGTLGAAAAAPRAPEARTSLSADGIWQMDGYGTALTIGGGVMRTWDTTAISCRPAVTVRQDGATGPDGTVRFAQDGAVLTVRPRTASRAVYSYDGAVGTQRMRRISALPALCGQDQPTGPVATFDVFWQTFKENYAFFAGRGVDWDAARAKYRPKVSAATPPGELFDILAAMVAPLQDSHVSLEAATPELSRYAETIRPGTTAPSREYDARVRKFIERRDLGGRPLEQYANGAIGYARLPGGIGYLRVSRFIAYTAGEYGHAIDSPELARVLDRIITRARTSGPDAWRGLIIDVRVNMGGMDGLGLQIANRLTDHPYTAYAKQTRNDPQDDTRLTPRQTMRVVPADDSPRYTGPIALLTSGSTVSAGETFTQALAGRPSPTVRIGENTQGVFSDTLARSLPNNWTFTLSNEKYTNSRGHSFEGPGIPPHLRTPVFTEKEFAADRDSAFDRARALLTTRR
ncbi:S41 family peptidase [Streptomyces sp. NPDC052164]|uniref:S41 family peptidase n=1 Tax=Streptomyces sp. NPDC052164 TaxID=3155529 RepID=UPI00341330D8